MEKVLVNDEPENQCFGCSPHNERGLRMTFVQTGPKTIESRYEVAPHMCGPPNVIHGGVQAVLLDEAIGMAARVGAGLDSPHVVTAEFELRYRRPAPIESPITVRGELIRVEGQNLFVEGSILSPEGETLTTARARWRALSGLE